MHTPRPFALWYAVLFCFAAHLFAGSPRTLANDAPPPKKTPGPSAEAEPEALHHTIHSISLDGKKLTYTATAGQLRVKPGKASGEEIHGRIFYVAYTRKGGDPCKRPLTFAFNGGPGAASLWLHLGGLGPKRIRLSVEGRPLPPPSRYGDNPHTWLAFTDLVFVDPVGTGFSRGEAEAEKVAGRFFGVQQDIEATAEFVRLYLTRNQRWLSPKYLVGESYGTTRVAGLAWHLNQRFGIDVNGIVFVSPVLDFHTILFHPANDLPYMLFLPSFAATARFHGLLPQETQQRDLNALLPEVEAFCLTEYASFLARGEAPAAETKQSIARRLHLYTGLPADLIEKNNHRIDWTDFTLNLMAPERRIIGRMDGTITGVNPRPTAAFPGYDPSLDPLFGSFAAAMNDYVRRELAFETDHVYEFLNADVNRQWDWASGISQPQGFVQVSGSLRDALAVNEHLKVWIACGRYDLATPYFTARYTVDHMWLGPRRADVTIRCYEAGHMIFTHAEALAQLTRDARGFYQEGQGGPP